MLPFQSRSPRWLALAACLLCLGLSVRKTQGQVSREYDLKAVLLFNLARFVEWPPEAFATIETPIVIGILGRDPFGKVLDDVVRAESIDGRPVVVQRYSDASKIGRCHILFISRSEGAQLPSVINRLKGKPILTVSDIEDFALHKGGMVRFYETDEKKIRIRIHLGNLKASGLNASAKLLRVAEVVGIPEG